MMRIDKWEEDQDFIHTPGLKIKGSSGSIDFFSYNGFKVAWIDNNGNLHITGDVIKE